MENNKVVLKEEQRKTLEKFINAGVHSVHLVKRARVIWAFDCSKKTEHLE